MQTRIRRRTSPANGAEGGVRGRISHSADGGFGGGGGTNDGGGGGGGYRGGGGRGLAQRRRPVAVVDLITWIQSEQCGRI